MGLFGTLGKIGFAGGKYLAKKTTVVTQFEWPLEEKLQSIKEESGLCGDFIQSVIRECRDINSLKIIRDYLTSERNSFISPEQTKYLLNQVYDAARQLKLNEIIGDPFALLESVVEYLC
jgi:hypothetical protein